MRNFVVLLIAVVPCLAIAKTPWPKDAKDSYIARCSDSMAAQGLSKQTASSYCSCAADGMDKEFGMEEYKQMMNAQPNPRGSPDDRRLFKVMSVCQKYLRP
jgi:hypothetical protein